MSMQQLDLVKRKRGWKWSAAVSAALLILDVFAIPLFILFPIYSLASSQKSGAETDAVLQRAELLIHINWYLMALLVIWCSVSVYMLAKFRKGAQ